MKTAIVCPVLRPKTGTLRPATVAGEDVFWDIDDKTGDLVDGAAAKQGTLLSVDEVEDFFGTSDANISQAALFLHFAGVEDGARVRENAFFHADDKNDGEFQAFGGVEGHESDFVLRGSRF